MSETPFFSVQGPFDSMPGARQMRTANFRGFPELVRHHGSDPRDILERHDIDPRAMRDPDQYMDCQSLVDVLEYCSSQFNDPLFGLRLAKMQDPDVYGCVTALCRSAPSVRQALTSFIDYIPVVHAPMAIIDLAEGKETTELRWWVRSSLGMNTQANYQATMLSMKLLRLVGGSDFRPSYVYLSGDTRQRDVMDVENGLGCRFYSKAATNAIAFPTEMLNRPVASANRMLFNLLGGYLERVKAASRTSLVDRVEDYVRGALPSGTCSIELCANKLGTSVRTLQAHLSVADIKFSDIVESIRMEVAESYLQQGELSLDDIADRLGYAEQSSFGRAFKRWTGTTPRQYRTTGGKTTH